MASLIALVNLVLNFNDRNSKKAYVTLSSPLLGNHRKKHKTECTRFPSLHPYSIVLQLF